MTKRKVEHMTVTEFFQAKHKLQDSEMKDVVKLVLSFFRGLYPTARKVTMTVSRRKGRILRWRDVGCDISISGQVEKNAN